VSPSGGTAGVAETVPPAVRFSSIILASIRSRADGRRSAVKDEHTERRTGNPAHRAAYAAATAAPAAHKPRLITSHHARLQIHGAGAVGRFNNALAVLITKSVGTMWAAYLFAVIGLVSLPQALTAFARGDTIVGISWLSQSFLQLVLLPIIIVGQNVISASQDARAEADHLTLTTLHEINVQQLQMLTRQKEMLQQQREILDLLESHDHGASAGAAGG
jgi:hypothetical protein